MRNKAWTDETRARALAMVASGQTHRAVGAAFGVSASAIGGLVVRSDGRKAGRARPSQPNRKQPHNAHDDARYIETWEARKARRVMEAMA